MRKTADSAELTLSPDIVDLHVEGVGRVAMPVRAPGARKLIAAARPAAFGRGEETLYDTDVRDTWEITPDQVRLEGAEWESALAAALEDLRESLGLSDGSRLRAQLHSMLLYGKGQFFLPHQDSEKHDDMVATLVLSLPSIHTGGELIVDDAGEERTYRGSRDALTLVAFYSDRRHEVKPVRSGHRVTLTFNLLLEAQAAAAAEAEAEEPAAPVGASASDVSDRVPSGGGSATVVRTVAGLLTEHFSTATTGPYGFREPQVPTRLAFLLDHEYSQRGLTLSRLKGADGQHARLLLDAADQADCDVVLALTEITETRDATGTSHDDMYFDDMYSDGGDLGGELLDGMVTATFWKDLDGGGSEVISLGLDEDELCQATPTHALNPYEEEYEGYMGNYGNTVERWYHRAAMILWPRRQAFTARAEASSGWALDTLATTIAAGEIAKAREDALSLAPFWTAADTDLLPAALDVSVGVDDAEAAAVLLAPFSLEGVGAGSAEALVALRGGYGRAWWEGLLEQWAPTGPTTSLLPVVRALRMLGADGEDCADMLVQQIWTGVQKTVAAASGNRSVASREGQLSQQGEPVARLLEAASRGVAKEMVAWLLSPEGSHLPLLLSTVRELASSTRAVSEGTGAAGYDRGAEGEEPTSQMDERLTPLALECMDRLTRVVTAPERDRDDWSIVWSGCGCDDCGVLVEFLRAGGERKKEWPLAKPRRQHIHRQIDDADLPVTHTTKRQGSPHKLMLAKTQQLFARETRWREQAAADLTWLRAVAKLRVSPRLRGDTAHGFETTP